MKKKKYDWAFQTSFDVAQVVGTTQEDRNKLNQDIADLINSNPKFACLNGIFQCDDMLHAYDLKELNKK